MYVRVRLNKPVQSDELEKALLDAAEEVGYNAEVKDLTDEVYKLGSVERVQEYDGTVVGLKKGVIPVMQVHFNRKYGPIESLGLRHGILTRGMAERYLAAVSELI